MPPRRLLRKWLLRLFGFALAAILIAWTYFSIPIGHLALSKDRQCKLEFHQWYTGRCILSYYENNVCVGTVRLHSDFFNNPIAFFPGPDGNSVICFSFLDTTYAVFTVDLSTRNSREGGNSLQLRVPDEPVVDRSDFKVRACTAKEVDFVSQYIQTVDLSTLANLVRGGATQNTRKNMLTHLTWATNQNNWQDPVLKYAKPQIMPEN